MDDYIILPDDDTLKRLSAEYAKVKAKTFADEKVTACNAAPEPRACNYCLMTLISALIVKSMTSK